MYSNPATCSRNSSSTSRGLRRRCRRQPCTIVLANCGDSVESRVAFLVLALLAANHQRAPAVGVARPA